MKMLSALFLLEHPVVYWQIYTKCERGFPTTIETHLRPVFSLFCSMLINLLRTLRSRCG